MNYMSLNYAGPFIRGFFFFTKYVLHHLGLVASRDMESWLQKIGSEVIYKFLTTGRVSTSSASIFQGSTVFSNI